MDDVNPTASQTPEVTGEVETPTPDTQPVKETAAPAEAGAQVPTPEKTVPYSRFSEVNKQMREWQRKAIEAEKRGAVSEIPEDEYATWMSNPMSQQLLIKVAKQELTDFARETVDQYPNLHPQVRKAIISNARGFVNEETTDVEQAKLDLVEWIEGVMAENPQTPGAPAKPFPVTATNTPVASKPGTRPAEIAAIMAKPVDQITDEEAKTLDDYRKSHPTK